MSLLRAEPGSTPRLVLPAIVDLTMAATLKQDCQAALARGKGLRIDAGAVGRISSPCLQVLVAAVRGIKAAGGAPPAFDAISDAMRECVACLALEDALGLGGTGK